MRGTLEAVNVAFLVVMEFCVVDWQGAMFPSPKLHDVVGPSVINVEMDPSS